MSFETQSFIAKAVVALLIAAAISYSLKPIKRK